MPLTVRSHYRSRPTTSSYMVSMLPEALGERAHPGGPVFTFS